MQAMEKLEKLAEYAHAEYEKSGTIIIIEVLPLGFSKRVSYRGANKELLQLVRFISFLEFDAYPLEGLKERIDRMVREVHLKYVQISNLEKAQQNGNITPNS